MSLKPVYNPPNPWHGAHAQWLPDLADLPEQQAQLQVFEERCQSIVSKNNSPDIGFDYSMNPYRGCAHACAYCYARPSHQYLDYGAGTDFETKLVVKVNAAQRLREHFEKKSWKGELIMLSGNTDCYQPLEAHYQLTRQCLEVFKQYQNPVAIITKGALIRRDAELLGQLNRVAKLRVNISIPFYDEAMSLAMEPGAPKPAARFETIRQLTQAGVWVSVMVAPIIPGLNDSQVPAILQAAREAGAECAFYTLLRLPAELKEVFQHKLRETLPSHAKKVMNHVRESRGGVLYRSNYGERHRGYGENWQATRSLFHLTAKKLGFNTQRGPDPGKGQSTFVRPGTNLTLF